MNRVKPVPGALEGVRALNNMGFQLVVVTAREMHRRDESWKWLDRHFPGKFTSLSCTSN
jgi:hypothetical protein